MAAQGQEFQAHLSQATHLCSACSATYQVKLCSASVYLSLDGSSSSASVAPLGAVSRGWNSCSCCQPRGERKQRQMCELHRGGWPAMGQASTPTQHPDPCSGHWAFWAASVKTMDTGKYFPTEATHHGQDRQSMCLLQGISHLDSHHLGSRVLVCWIFQNPSVLVTLSLTEECVCSPPATGHAVTGHGIPGRHHQAQG